MSRNKSSKPDPASARREQRAFYAALAFFVVVLVAFVFVLIRPELPTAPPAPTATPRQFLTPDATVVANATRMANDDVTPLSPAQLTEIDDLQAAVAGCAAYSDQRRSQMEQHLEWLRDPSQIPEDIVTAFASNPPERLLYGMAVYTLTEWRLAGRPADSCLVEIGRTLNTRLIAAGGESPGDYDE